MSDSGSDSNSSSSDPDYQDDQLADEAQDDDDVHVQRHRHTDDATKHQPRQDQHHAHAPTAQPHTAHEPPSPSSLHPPPMHHPASPSQIISPRKSPRSPLAPRRSSPRAVGGTLSRSSPRASGGPPPPRRISSRSVGGSPRGETSPSSSSKTPMGHIARRTRAQHSLAGSALEELEEMLLDTPSPVRRTRAQHSLAGSALVEREDMLQDTPSPVSGTGGDDGDNAGGEWQHFLSSVRQPDLARPPPAQQQQHVERSRKRSRVRFDDGEARLSGSSGRSHRSKRGERRSVGSGGGGGFASILLDDEEEYNESEDDDYWYELSDDQEEEEWDADAIAEDEVNELFREATTSRQSSRRAARSPYAGASPDGWGEAASGFTPAQVQQLQMQMHVHMQQLVQVMLLAREALTEQSAFKKVALLPFAMLAELCTYCDVSLAYKQLRQRPTHATPLSAATDEGLAGVHRVGRSVDTPPVSIFSVPGLHLLRRLLPSRSIGLRRLYESDDLTHDEWRDTLPSQQFDLREELSTMRPYFNFEYAPRVEIAPSESFTTAEEELLALGIRRFGHSPSQLDLVRTHLLPTKTTQAVTAHFRRCMERSRWAEYNPVKRAVSQRAADWLPAEEAQLVDAVKRCGENWRLISSIVLPHRSADQLRAKWEATQQLNRIAATAPPTVAQPTRVTTPPAARMPSSSTAARTSRTTNEAPAPPSPSSAVVAQHTAARAAPSITSRSVGSHGAAVEQGAAGGATASESAIRVPQGVASTSGETGGGCLPPSQGFEEDVLSDSDS